MHASTLRIAWRNLWRNRRRTALAVLAIAVGQWALLATLGMTRGYADNVQNAITGPMIGHVQIHAPDYRKERALDLYMDDIDAKVAAIDAVPGVADAAPRIYAPALMAPTRDAYISVIVGIDIVSESKPFGLLSGNHADLKPGHVMVGTRLARQSGAEVGQEIALVGQAADGSLANDLFTVQAIIEGPADLVNQSGVVMSLADAQRFLVMPDEAHEIVIRADSPDDLTPLVAELKALPQLQGLDVATWRELVPQLVLIIETANYSAYFVLALVLIVAVAGIVNTLMMATYERMHEFGMLLAFGCHPGRIIRMVVIEAVFLGALGVIVGTLLGVGFVAVTAHTGINMASWGGEHVGDLAYGGMRLPLEIIPRLEWADPLMGLVAVVVVSLIAAVWPAIAAGRLDPMEAMRA